MTAPRRVVAPVVLALAVSLGGVGAGADPIDSLPARTLAIEGGIVSFRAALVVDISNPNLLSTFPTKSEDDISEHLRLAGALELVVEEGLKEQITLSIPGGWSAHDQTKLLTGMPGPLGTVLYSPAKLVSDGEEKGDTLSETLMRLSSGEIPSLQLDRIPAPKGTTCAGITPAAQRRILRMVEDQDPMFARGHTVVEAARAEPAALTGVRGLHIRARSRNPEGVEQALDLIALSDGTTLYLLYARASADHFELSRGILDRVLPTVQLTRCGARP